ncbi:MAG: aldehyde dehydrogenase family protein, partial [Deltaproteobacteria bacterium]
MSAATAIPETLASVTSFLAEKHALLIGGRWIPAASGETFAVENPAREDTLAHAAKGGAEDIDRAVMAARQAFEEGPWRRMNPSERGQLLWKLADLIEAHAEEFAQLESLDNGKPLAVARAADVALAVDHFRYYAGWATKIEGETIPINGPSGSVFLDYTLREPVGVVGQIIPWNFPLLMAAWKLGPALACGNSVVLKPAEQTPLTALRLGRLICEVGFPDGTVNIVTGFGDAGAALANHDGVDKLAFTGSTEVGHEIVRASATNLKRVSLELGGKSPTIVFDDADLELAAEGVAGAIFFNHGQCCCAGSRMFAARRI